MPTRDLLLVIKKDSSARFTLCWNGIGGGYDSKEFVITIPNSPFSCRREKVRIRTFFKTKGF